MLRRGFVVLNFHKTDTSDAKHYLCQLNKSGYCLRRKDCGRIHQTQ